jgi:hypothetical protein
MIPAEGHSISWVAENGYGVVAAMRSAGGTGDESGPRIIVDPNPAYYEDLPADLLRDTQCYHQLA